MEPNKFTLIDEIDSKKDSLKIKVRIIRMWKQPYTTDLILMDEKGERIHAAVKKQFIPIFEPLLEQGLAVVITKFGVAENGGQYPILKHPFKLNFYRHTTVKRCPDFQGSLYGFRFVPFPGILNKEVDATEDVDVIGNVVSCGNLDVYNNRNGKEQKRMNFELQDIEGNVVSCTLWDGFAQQLADFVNGHEKDDYVIMIIQLGKVREWKGSPTVQNALFASRLFINDDVEEIHHFKKRNNHPLSKNFIKNIRTYNTMFAFTSMGGKVDKAINKGRGPYVFRLGGQNFHRLGSLLPTQGSTPKFSQLYIYDTDNELDNRKNAVRSASDNASSSNDTLDPRIISDLKDMLDVENPLVISYRMARDRFNENDQQPVKLRLLGTRQKDGRTHNLPTASEVAAIIIGDIDSSFDKRDIVVETQDGSLKRISELHPLYLPLQYPLLFPKAEDGWRLGIKHKGLPNDAKGTRTDVTIREFFAFMIQDRPNVPRLLLLARKLFQQFLVDAYTMIESQKFHFYRTNQKKFRCDSYHNLAAAVDDGNTEASSTGKRIKIPSSFTGGPRYMMQKYLDAMALCKTFGYPDLFITVTCNPKWPEITRFLEDKKLSSEDRPDVLCRVFKMKLDQMIEDFKKNKLFGSVLAVVYDIENVR